MIRLARLRMQGSRESGQIWERSWHVDSEDEIDDCLRANWSYRGFRAMGEYDVDNWEPDDASAGFIVTIRYGRVVEDMHGPEGGEYGGDEALWSLDAGFERKAIESHPKINELIQDYGGEEDPTTHRVTFRRILQDAGPMRDRRGLLGQAERTEEGDWKNPLYGIQESGYLVMGGAALCRYKTADVSDLMQDVGKVFKTLPGAAPDFGVGDDRDWIKMPPVASPVAEEENGRRWYEVEHRFMLSDIGGWPPGVYEFIEV